MKRNSYFALSLLVCLSLTGCKNNEEKSVKYVDKNINIIRSMNKGAGAEVATPVVDKTMSLRFYEATPNVPYVEVGEYFKEFFKTTLSTSKKNNTIKYSRATGEFLAFDAVDDVFSSNELLAFNSHPDYKSETHKTFIKPISQTISPKSTRHVHLKNYSINIHEENNKAYVPFSFLSKLAGGFEGYNASYNGKDIYVFDTNKMLTDVIRDSTYYKDSYYEILDDYSKPRPYDLASYNYHELCFVFDNLRGYTSQLLFGDNNLITLGLDGLLSSRYPSIKRLLLSSVKEEYYTGFAGLFYGLFDGGHTVPLVSSQKYVTASTSTLFYPEIDEIKNQYIAEVTNVLVYPKVFQKSRASAFGISGSDNYYYLDSANKTAFIGFDSFKVDYNGWDNYYNNNGQVPVNSDTYAFIRSKLLQAKDDGVKNVVLDLTANGGGNSHALEGIVGLFNEGKSDFSLNNTFNKYKETTTSLIDIDLDGDFDEADKEMAKSFDFNVGVLTSEAAFSCGNLFPSIMKELGYKILGEKSGGGSCAIIEESSADGCPYVHSSYLCLSDSSGNNIDSGIPVDFEIERTPIGIAELDAVYRVAGFKAPEFFNVETIAEYLNSAY